jgi:hypothetical protein
MVCQLSMITPVIVCIRIERLLDALQKKDKERIVYLCERFLQEFDDKSTAGFDRVEVDTFKDELQAIMLLAMLDVFSVSKCSFLHKYTKRHLVIGKGIVSLLQKNNMGEDSLGTFAKLPYDLRYHLSIIVKQDYSI